MNHLLQELVNSSLNCSKVDIIDFGMSIGKELHTISVGESNSIKFLRSLSKGIGLVTGDYSPVVLNSSEATEVENLLQQAADLYDGTSPSISGVLSKIAKTIVDDGSSSVPRLAYDFNNSQDAEERAMIIADIFVTLTAGEDIAADEIPYLTEVLRSAYKVPKSLVNQLESIMLIKDESVVGRFSL